MSRRWITKPTPGSNGEYCTIVDAIEGRAVARHVKPADALEIIGLESLSADLNGIAMEWERSMMAAIGEDGVKSVSDAIDKLKAERDELLDALKKVFALLFDETHTDIVISRNDLRDLISKAEGKV